MRPNAWVWIWAIFFVLTYNIWHFSSFVPSQIIVNYSVLLIVLAFTLSLILWRFSKNWRLASEDVSMRRSGSIFSSRISALFLYFALPFWTLMLLFTLSIPALYTFVAGSLDSQNYVIEKKQNFYLCRNCIQLSETIPFITRLCGVAESVYLDTANGDEITITGLGSELGIFASTLAKSAK